MNDAQLKTFALALLRANSEHDVIEILTEAGYWNDPASWRLYGDKEGNFAQVGNQQSIPEAALVEKIINSVDSRLMSKCLIENVDPISDAAPKNIRDAVAMFFEGRRAEDDEAGTLANWSAQQRTAESREITLVATGDRPTRGHKSMRMCLTITDLGEGQSPSRLPNTILSLNAKNKQRIRFVQGKFNMGGSGALRFCGQQGIQLVITKRNPQIAAKERADDPNVDHWAVTVVRREEPSNKSGEPIHSEFTYLAPVGAAAKPRLGEVLSFNSASLPIMPEHDEPYARDADWGTVIKLYEYETTVGQSNVLLKDGLLFALERLMPEIALPIRVHECRGYEGVKERSFETPIAGLVVRLEEGRGDNLEQGFPVSAKLYAAGTKMTARIYAFKEDRAGTYLKDEGVIFEINGQAHGYLPKSIFSRPKRVGLPRLKDSLLVLVDCSSLSARQREDLFMSSRDRLSKNSIRLEIEDEIMDMLKNQTTLKQLQLDRRQKDVESRLSEEKPLEEVLSKVLKASPTLKTLFLAGQRLPKPFDIGGSGGSGGNSGNDGGSKKHDHCEAKFHGRRHPTYFKTKGVEYGKLFRRNCETGRKVRITFETDVENDYFNRVTDSGNFELEVVDSDTDVSAPNANITLDNGEAHLNMTLPDEVAIGDSLIVKTTVDDPTLTKPFINLIKLTVLAKQTKKPSHNKNARKTGTGAGDDGQKLGISLPSIVPVRYGDENWSLYKFQPETATHVVSEPTEIDGKEQICHTFYINVDNTSLKTEMKHSKQDSRLLEAKFKYGNVLLGLAMLHDCEQDSNGKGKSDGPSEGAQPIDERIRVVTEAIAPVLLPMIDQLSDLDETSLDEGAVVGEDM